LYNRGDIPEDFAWQLFVMAAVIVLTALTARRHPNRTLAMVAAMFMAAGAALAHPPKAYLAGVTLPVPVVLTIWGSRPIPSLNWLIVITAALVAALPVGCWLVLVAR